MEYDYSKLSGRIIEKFRTQGNFAKKMHLSEKSMSSKLTNKTSFKQNEIDRAIILLDLSKDDIQDYFFTKCVQ